ncbi:MAG: helix-turn-helix transcriptional regulator [Clostridia bacterium]|nr:helix-turn-helix transcriptional regulator [Clostridia bacterium]
MSADEKYSFRQEYITKLTDNLAMLMAKAKVSQADVADIIGIARQTYSNLETGKKSMTWNMFLSLILFFKENDETANVIRLLDIYTDELEAYIKNSK